MSVTLALLCCPLAASADGSPDTAARLLAKVRGDDSAASEAAFAELRRRADAWRDPASRDAAVENGSALRTLAAGDSPFAARADAALTARHAAVAAELEARGVNLPDDRRYVLGADGPIGPGEAIPAAELRTHAYRIRFFRQAPGTGDPHPADLLRLLELDGRPVHLDDSFRGAGLTAATVRAFARVPNLVELQLHANATIDAAEWADWDDACLAPLARHPTLADVQFKNIPVGPAGCGTLASLPNLRQAYCYGGRGGDAGLRALAEVSGLKSLTLYASGVTDAGLADLPRLPAGATLITLQVGGSGVTDRGLAALVGMPELRRAGVLHSPATGVGLAALTQLSSIDLRSGSATDEGVRAIAALPNLRSLWVDGGTATDAVFAPLARCERLSGVTFQNVPVAGPGLAALADRPAEPFDTGRDALVPLWIAALSGRTHRPTASRAEAVTAWALFALGMPTLPGPLAVPAVPALLIAHQPRRVAVVELSHFKLRLAAVGLTDDLLRSLPPLEVTSLALSRDPMTKAGVLAFARGQPHLRSFIRNYFPDGDRWEEVVDLLSARRRRGLPRPAEHARFLREQSPR